LRSAHHWPVPGDEQPTARLRTEEAGCLGTAEFGGMNPAAAKASAFSAAERSPAERASPLASGGPAGPKSSFRPLDADGDISDMPTFGDRPSNEPGMDEFSSAPPPPPSEAGSDVQRPFTPRGGEATAVQDTSMRFGSLDSQIPAEPDSSSLLQGAQGSQTPSKPSGSPPSVFEREGQRPPFTSISVPRRCTAKDPFWVASSGSAHRGGAGGGDAAAGPAGGRGLAGVPLRCLSDVVDAADRELELEVPEAELSTVHIETWEQRLDWRSFLSEAVASSRARQLFKAFDVEAEPPKYARPPPSLPVSVMENALPSGTSRRVSSDSVSPAGASGSPSVPKLGLPVVAKGGTMPPGVPAIGSGDNILNGKANGAQEFPQGDGGCPSSDKRSSSRDTEAFDPSIPASVPGDSDAGL